ncbi:MAG: hypothetical protein COV43_05820 [Deltaproteobacteria bacterium CG11_big_fil_rev_8_21_14_0_20_42_23]|nr:MAG: hypothetical protein COV43_05820 [Deltaproteobacteria bacterium CG11_big_fil_rev_8_21_14_0_20_42_23]PJC63683.1 MAG: hypothetical protein CO021_08340 [Deltaproteobacteria bacterium CG_4_9_14_0_2_um_filter_42_21]
MNILNKESILEQAALFLEEGKIDRAIREYEKILAIDADDTRVHLKLAELYSKNKQLNQAIKSYCEVAKTYAKQKFYLKAVTVYKNVLRLNPSLMEINLELASLYEKMDLNTDAVKQHQIIASAYERRGQTKDLIKEREKIVQLLPDHIPSRLLLAELYQRNAETDLSIDQYEAMVALLEKQEGTETKRAEYYEKILHHRPDRVKMFRDLVAIYHEQKEFKKALKWLEEKSDITPYDVDLLSIQAEIYASLNQLETARNTYYALADLYLDQHDIDAALNAYAEVLVFLPEEEENIRKHTEEFEEGTFDIVLSRVQERRAQIDEQVKQKEEEERKKAEAKQNLADEAKREEEEEFNRQRLERIKQIQSKLGKKADAKPLEKKNEKIKQKKNVNVEKKETKTPQSKEKEITSPDIVLSPSTDFLPSQKKVLSTIDASLKLAKAYKRMGLKDEAKNELQQSKADVQELLQKNDTEELRKKLEEIENLLES